MPTPPSVTTPAALRAALQAGAQAAARYRLAVPREALRGAAGTRLGRQTGASVDFLDFREYQPGDDLRHLDWNVVARSDRYVIKLHREEVSPHLDIVLDVSRSMDLPGTAKAAAAVQLAALLAGAAARAHCTWRLWRAGEDCIPLPGGHLDPLRWEAPAFDSAASPEVGLTASRPAWRRNGLRVLISDLLWQDDPLRVLRPLSDRAAALTALQVLAREERAPEGRGNLRLREVESGAARDLYADAVTFERYRAACRAHGESWQAACRRCGATLTTLEAETLAAGDAAGEALTRHGLLERM
jgi:uncharacterized protein (DUF58 family)